MKGSRIKFALLEDERYLQLADDEFIDLAGQRIARYEIDLNTNGSKS